MTKREAAILSAHTGIMFGSFSDLHEYAEKILGEPIFTHEFASNGIVKKLKVASKKDFIKVMESITP